jgi:hypothetical protein
MFSGDGRFRVLAYNLDGRGDLADETGTFSQKVGIPDGTFLLGVRAGSGSWSITPG